MPETSIKVAIRVRPSLLGESIIEDGPIKIDEEGTRIEIRNVVFAFDTIFASEASNECVYKKLVSEDIKHLVEGFNVSILAYGATGSGKTFTMGTASKLQAEDSLGLIPLGLKEIFEHIDAISEETIVAVNVSFFEIYMENVKDLLKSQSSFSPGDSKEAKISNMSQVSVQNYDEAMQTLRKGCHTRITAATSKNARSSRSHAFYIVSLVMTNKKTGKSKYSKFQVVDLAGSERAGLESSGKEFKQGVLINKGLTALGRVITSLSKKDKHIPYRDSLLTRYLQDSFGGNSHTVMITCISPAQGNVEESLSSLRYSSFAKNIKNTVIINRDSTDFIEHLKSELERLKNSDVFKEKEELKEKINHLDDCLKRNQNNMEKIKEKVLEFLTSIQSLEEKMVSKTFKKSDLQLYIEIVRSIKEDLNSFIREPELFCCFLDKDTSASCEEMDISPDMDISPYKNISPNINISPNMNIYPGIIRQTESAIEAVDVFNKVHLLEMEIRSYENIKVLYDFLPCEVEHNKITNELESLLNERNKLSKVEFRSDEVNNKIQSLEKEIMECQQKTKLFAFAVKMKSNVLKHHDHLKQSLMELKEKQTEGVQEKFHQEPTFLHDEAQQSTSEEVKLNKLEEEAQKVDKVIERLNTHNYKRFPSSIEDIGEDSLSYIEYRIRAEVWTKIAEYEIKKFTEKFEETRISKEPILQEIQNKPAEVDEKAERNYGKRIAVWWHDLEIFRERCCFKLEIFSEDTARFLFQYLFTKTASLQTDYQVMLSRFQKFAESSENVCESDKVKFFELELNKVKSEKYFMDFLQKKQIRDLNSEWESKMLVLLEMASKDTEVLRSPPPNLPMDMTTLLQNLWNQRDNKYEEKCKEVEELKMQLRNVEEENLQLRQTKFKCPNLAASPRRPKPKSLNEPGFSMMEAFLSDEEISLSEESELFDPDYRATPLWKRNRSQAKRKAEECDLICSPIPPKTQSPSGCSCPGECGTMRCSCKKKKNECSAFCECNKAKCMNTPSSLDQ